jgi:hypothetical protein
MAIKKDVKPLNAMRHDFVAALENVTQQSIMFLTAVETAARHGRMGESTRDVLEKQAASFRKALFGEDDGH